ncbi:MAG: exodeoxyribonuclease VII small subunit [Oscillospiraceae bacterium]|jgi:exodeoxyribonuclease VII small subunit|nr:exodeoxyribonuclease VII small subunit [Oscillospiraceae bacterium]
MAEKKPDFEQSVNRLNEIIRALERGDTPLEDSIKLFEEGAKLAGHCETLLRKAEQRVSKLVKTGDTVIEEPFEPIE